MIDKQIAIAKRYLQMLEDGADSAEFMQILHPNIVQREFPNQLTPNGATRDLAAMMAGVEQGKRIMTSQRYEVQNVFGSSNQVVLEIRWSGMLAIPIGNLQIGDVMRANIATILTFLGDQIIAQHNYDCFAPM